MKKRGDITINRILSYFNQSEVNVYLAFDLHTKNRYQTLLTLSNKNNFKPSPPSKWLEKQELMSYTQIAKILNLSRKQVKEIEQTAFTKIKRILCQKNFIG